MRSSHPLTPTIDYRINAGLDARAVAEVFQSSGIRRPVEDLTRIRRMLEHANLSVSAWDAERLIGLARALTDFSYCCYLSDIAVHKDYQRQGIGKNLVQRLREQLSDEVMVILVAAPEVMDYYKHLYFERNERVWYVPRKR